MSVIRRKDDKNFVIATKIIDHSELQNRGSYNCHPMSAISGLDERLSAIENSVASLTHDEEVRKDLSTEISNEISNRQGAAEELSLRVDDAEEKVLRINIQEDNENPGKLLFTDGNNVSTSLRSGYVPDDISVGLNSNDQLIIKKVFANNDTISGLGTAESPLVAHGITEENNGEPITYTAITIRNTFERIDGDLSEIQRVSNEQSSNISLLSEKIEALQGVGTYLPAENFGANVTDELLNSYAKQILNLTEDSQIPNGTRVKNTTDGHVWILNNVNDTLIWIDSGTDTVAVATNQATGIVKGNNQDDLKVSVDVNGEMTVNNLSNYLDDIIVKVGGTKTNDDVVTGTLYNRISVNEANIESLNTDVSNVYGSLNNKQDNLRFVETLTGDETIYGASISLVDVNTDIPVCKMCGFNENNMIVMSGMVLTTDAGLLLVRSTIVDENNVKRVEVNFYKPDGSQISPNGFRIEVKYLVA